MRWSMGWRICFCPDRPRSLAGTGICFAESFDNKYRCVFVSLCWVVADVLQHNPNDLASINTIRLAEWLGRIPLRHSLHVKDHCRAIARAIPFPDRR